MALSDADESQLVQLLKQLEPGFLPYDVFVQIARLTVLPIIEFVPLRLNDRNQVEVLLLSRGSDDPIWPNELHVPGTVVRATDNGTGSYEAFERILKAELHGTYTSTPYYVGSNLHKSRRGTEQAQVFWVEVTGQPAVGEFHDARYLPSDVIESQLGFIRLAVDSFKKYKLDG